MRAVILAGGLGTRLRPIVHDRPKVMSNVGGRPFLELVIAQLARAQVSSITLAVGYGADHVRGHFGTGADFRVGISYSEDGPQLLGTAGALARAIADFVPDDDEVVLVVNGDTYLEYDPKALVRGLEKPGVRVVLAAVRVADATRYGTIRLGEGGAVVAFEEKGAVGSGLVNAGVYCAFRETWRALLPPSQPCSLERDVLPALVGPALLAVECNGLFVDIGVPADYLRAEGLLRSVT